jgi:hypothetical protein
MPGPFRKECSARFGKESSPFLRGASRAPFVSRALLAFLSSDFKSLQASRSAPLLLAFALQILRCLSDAPRVLEDAADRQMKRPIFAKEKARNAEHEIRGRLIKGHKGASMEYLILVAVLAMMGLYALIIVGCLKQPEW